MTARPVRHVVRERPLFADVVDVDGQASDRPARPYAQKTNGQFRNGGRGPLRSERPRARAPSLNETVSVSSQGSPETGTVSQILLLTTETISRCPCNVRGTSAPCQRCQGRHFQPCPECHVRDFVPTSLMQHVVLFKPSQDTRVSPSPSVEVGGEGVKAAFACRKRRGQRDLLISYQRDTKSN